MVVRLHDDGLFNWKEWTLAISNEIKCAQSSGDPDWEHTYYRHWLNALEGLVRKKGILKRSQLFERKEEWHSAYLATPHGHPVRINTGATRQL